MSERTIKRSLNASALVEVTGCGDGLTFKVNAWRKTKGGAHERYLLEISVCRGSVTQLLGELRKMHVRDRAFIQRQQARIDREVRELTQEQA